MREGFFTRRLLPALGAALVLAGLWLGVALAAGQAEAVSQSDIDDMEAQLSDLAGEIQALEGQLDEISGQRDQALEELAQAREELAAQGTVIVSEGEWYWPVPGSYTLTISLMRLASLMIRSRSSLRCASSGQVMSRTISA